MYKTFNVAIREFLATVMTRAFLLAAILPPALVTAALTLAPLLMNQASPRVNGTIAVLDQSGAVAPLLKDTFESGRMQSRREARMRQKMEEVGSKIPGADPKKLAAQANAMEARTNLTLSVLPAGADIGAEKSRIAKSNGKDTTAGPANPTLALIVIPTDAVAPGEGKEFQTYSLYVAPRLDVEVQGDIRDQVSKAVVDARLAAGSYDVKRIRRMMELPKVDATIVTEGGERKSNEIAAFLVPGAFLMLLWASVFTAGQYLLTSTIEEKSNRVMEVLLSAVSPMQLMVGKIVGQMAVGAVMLCTYSGVGMAALAYASMKDLIDPMNLVYLGIYFIIAFFLIASLMAAIGSAVSDVREAQSLLMPVMLVLLIPMILWMPILRNPNSAFAQIVSFVPPVSPFVMVLRLAGSEPVPFWQIPATIIAGIVYAIVGAWAAAKIFRIGVLMYGKPPNFATLIKWVRMA